MAAARILIAGIGNIFLGDDGFGCEVTARLLRQEWPDGLRVADFGIRGLDLAYELSEAYDAVILVDAAPRGGVPGTIYVIEVDSREPGDLNARMQIDAHAMDPLSVLSLARSLGGEIGRIFIVGCEPLSLGPEEGRMGLSEPVSAAVDEAVRAVESLVNSIFCWKVEERDEESIYAQEQENESSHSERYRRSAARRGGSRSGCDSS